MNIVAWILQGTLAVLYVWHGTVYLGPIEWATQQGMQPPDPAAVRRFIGLAELLAAAGLVLPGLTGKSTWLTPVAAVGLLVVMSGAIVYHVSRHETRNAIFAALVLVPVAVVAVVRWRVVPLS